MSHSLLLNRLDLLKIENGLRNSVNWIDNQSTHFNVINFSEYAFNNSGNPLSFAGYPFISFCLSENYWGERYELQLLHNGLMLKYFNEGSPYDNMAVWGLGK